MSDEPNSYVRALADEYRMSRQTGQEVRVICVAEELTRYGWNVDDRTGELVRIAERVVARPALETPESPAPRKRTKAADG